MLPALDAILGHKSAHSLETGPVMAEPFISPYKRNQRVRHWILVRRSYNITMKC